MNQLDSELLLGIKFLLWLFVAFVFVVMIFSQLKPVVFYYLFISTCLALAMFAGFEFLNLMSLFIKDLWFT